MKLIRGVVTDLTIKPICPKAGVGKLQPAGLMRPSFDILRPSNKIANKSVFPFVLYFYL